MAADLLFGLGSKFSCPRDPKVVEALMVAVRAALSQGLGPMADERPRDTLARHECC